MVRYGLKLKEKNYGKLAAMLFSDSRKLFVLAGGVFLLALSFVLFFVSLNSTIVASKRQQTVDTHGKFLGVFSDIDEETANEIMETEPGFFYEIFQMQGELYYGDERFFAGWVTEETGKNMGIFLKEGVWPEKENDILLEEYLAYHFGISSYPQRLVLQRDGQETEYTVCGVIGNYSSNLSVSYRDVNGKKNYPSIITANYAEGNPVSLLVLQKRLDMGTAQENIHEVMFLYEKYGIDFEQVCLNKYLGEGYINTEDFEKVSLLYTMAVLFLLVLVEIVIFRAFFLKNRQAKRSMEEMGLQKKEYIYIYVWQFGKLFLMVVLFLLVLGILWGKIGGYVTGYGALLEKQVCYALLKELALIAVLLLILAFMAWDYKTGKKNDAAEQKMTYRYLFRKVNVPMFFMQFVFLVFVLFSFCLRERFAYQEEEIKVIIRAQSMGSYRWVEHYAFHEKTARYYEKDSSTLFEEYLGVLDMYMTAEMRFASLLNEKEHMLPYFEQLLALCDDSEFSKDSVWEEKLSEEAKQHESLPWDSFEVLVLPDRQYKLFLEENSLIWKKELNASDAIPECVMFLPYSTENEKMIGISDGSLIMIGRIFLQNEQLLLEKEEFRVRKVIQSVTGVDGLIMKKHLCILVLSTSEAEKSELISGYSCIDFRLTKMVTEEQQNEISNKIAMLAATQQGGGSYSSIEEQKEDALFRSYAAFMGSTMLVFGMLVMGAFVCVHFYVNWEKNKYAYGVFRSMGMSYRTLCRKLIVQYMTGIVFAWPAACFVVEKGFGHSFTAGQAALSGSFLFISVEICYGILYYVYKNRRICDMLQNG